jgi:hypothetical protein
MGANAFVLEEILRIKGPMLSSQLAKALMMRGISADYARKLLQRSSEEVNKLRGIRFPHNGRFVYLKDQFGSTIFWESLVESLRSEKTAYGIALNSVLAHDGAVPVRHFDIVSGRPSLPLKGHISTELVLKQLTDVGLLEQREIGRLGTCITATRLGLPIADRITSIHARKVAEEILLSSIKEWVKRTGLASFHKVRIRDDGPTVPHFGQFAWDLVGPTYVHPLVRYSGTHPVPGFVVADVFISREEVNLDAVQYFMSKVEIMRSQRTTRPFLSLFVANRFSPQAFAIGKKKGLLFVTPGDLLGTNVAQALAELITTLTNAGAAVAKNPEVVYDIFQTLGKIEGAAGNLRGPLFELIVAHCVKSVEGGSVDIGKIVTDLKTGETAEADVLLFTDSKKILVYECKGIAANKLISKTDVTDWLDTTIPRIRNWLLDARKDQASNRPIQFSIWTSGDFHPEARVLLQQAKTRTHKYAIDFKDGKQVFEYARQQNSKRILDVLNEHYLKASALPDIEDIH